MKRIRISKYIDDVMQDDPVSNQTVINWIKSGQIQGEKRGGLWLVCVEDSGLNSQELLALLEASL